MNYYLGTAKNCLQKLCCANSGVADYLLSGADRPAWMTLRNILSNPIVMFSEGCVAGICVRELAASASECGMVSLLNITTGTVVVSGMLWVVPPICFGLFISGTYSRNANTEWLVREHGDAQAFYVREQQDKLLSGEDDVDFVAG